jgi:hypothetical protein
MPHVDGMMLRTGWTRRGESCFAAPVARVTAFVRALGERTRALVAQRRHGAGDPPHRQDGRDASFTSATDIHDLERMERDWNRRDGGGMRSWDQR